MIPKRMLYIIPVLILIPALIIFLWPEDLSNSIVIPYISHQKPVLDPHLPAADDLSDKLDEVVFDGLFNLVATPSGIAYEDGLGEFMGIDRNNVVSIRLKPGTKWHSSFTAAYDDGEESVTEGTTVPFTARDLQFTLRRLQRLGSLSRDYILVSQALKSFDFDGPDENNEVRFFFKGDRLWSEDEIKEILSFKILPKDSELNAPAYTIGTGPYLAMPLNEEKQDTIEYYKNPAGQANIARVILQPFIDNSTFTTEMNNARFNVLLNTPFGSLSPILEDPEQYFYTSNISTAFFALLFNTERLSRSQRQAIRRFIDNKTLMERLFKVNTEQQRHIVDYKGRHDNYDDYLNDSIFPSSSYYIEEDIVTPEHDSGSPDLSALPDTIRIVACSNYGFREEYNELIEILNDESLFFNKIDARIVRNEELKTGDYDAVLVAFSGYKSNFLFDLYDVLMREPDLATYKINLITTTNDKGEETAAPATWRGGNNFNRLDAGRASPEQKDVLQLMEYVHSFMSTREIGDKQAYAGFIDKLEHEMALGDWLFSMPSLAYFNTQFDSTSIYMYGVASQLSTIEKWKEQAQAQ